VTAASFLWLDPAFLSKAYPHTISKIAAPPPPAAFLISLPGPTYFTYYEARVAAVTSRKSLGQWLEEAIREKLGREPEPAREKVS